MPAIVACVRVQKCVVRRTTLEGFLGSIRRRKYRQIREVARRFGARPVIWGARRAGLPMEVIQFIREHCCQPCN